MQRTITLHKGSTPVYLNEYYNQAIDRVRAEVTRTRKPVTSISVPCPDLLTLARVLVNGEGEMQIATRYQSGE